MKNIYVYITINSEHADNINNYGHTQTRIIKRTKNGDMAHRYAYICYEMSPYKLVRCNKHISELATNLLGPDSDSNC